MKNTNWEQWFKEGRREVRTLQRQSRKEAYASFNSLVLTGANALGKDFPWRHRRTPYRVLVSEIMLQQTQADRVVPLYKNFLKQFPSFKALAEANQSEVIKYWQGLGYNRRALFLHRLAKEVHSEFSGRLPKDPALLETLPGIGSYTSRSVLVFAHNQSHVFIETNIRSMFLYYFTGLRKPVADAELLPKIEAALNGQDPREWYEALMDVGSLLKRTVTGLNKHSAGYQKQSRFEGSFRQKRGAVLKRLSRDGVQSEATLQSSLELSKRDLLKVLQRLQGEGFIERKGGKVTLI